MGSDRKRRPSQFLLDRAEALKQAFGYFVDTGVGPEERSTKEKLLSFLAQIDFWHWEMESLIFAYDNFDKRSRAWSESKNAMERLLVEKGFSVKKGILDEMRDKVRTREWLAYGRGKTEVYAPMETLDQVLEVWDRVLDACERSVLQEIKYDPAELGMNVTKGTPLGKFRFDRRSS